VLDRDGNAIRSTTSPLPISAARSTKVATSSSCGHVRPDPRIYASYLQAGADILKTNTFGATPLVLAEYALAESARE